MANSTKPAKPSKPYEGFPLYAHASRKWAKKIRGKIHYFGKWDDPQAALDEYLDQRDELHSGRLPKSNQGQTEVKDLCNEFLTAKTNLLASGEITERTFRDYHTTCQNIVNAFGKRRMASDLSSADFQKFRNTLAETRGPVALGNEINRTRCVFKFGTDNELIPSPVRYGQGFRRPSAKVLRIARAKRGPRMFESAEIRALLKGADNPIRTFVLLGINAGLGQSDIAQMPAGVLFDAVRTGWLDYPRPKTGVPRRAPLWDETQTALAPMVDTRLEPKDPKHAELAFLTRCGHPWVRPAGDAVGGEFKKILSDLDLQRPGRGFYALRHTFQTIAGDSKDPDGVSHIMGHADASMANTYRERIADERLQTVVNVVYAWLFKE